MRVLVPLVALLFTTGAAAPLPVPPRATEPSMLQTPRQPVNCRDRIQEVREERGLPQIERETASPNEALFIAAVDKRIDGCSVMVMRNDTSDIRPLPVIEGEGRVERIPARRAQ